MSATNSYEEKIQKVQREISALENELNSLTGMGLQIATAENGREIRKLNEKISNWQQRLNETPEEKTAREKIEQKYSARLERLTNRFDELEQNDWDY